MNTLPSSPGATRSSPLHLLLRGVGAVLKAAIPWNPLVLVVMASGIAAAIALPIASSSVAGIVAFLPVALILPGWMALWQAVLQEHVPAVTRPLWIALIVLLACSHASATALVFLGEGDVWMALSVHTLCVAVLLGLMGSGYILIWAVGAAVVYEIIPLGDGNAALAVCIVLIVGIWQLQNALIALMRGKEWRFLMAVSVLLLLHAELMLAPTWVDDLVTDSYLAGLWNETGKFLMAVWILGPLLLWHSLARGTRTEPLIEYLGGVEWLHGFRAGHWYGLLPDVAQTARLRKVDHHMMGTVDVMSDASRPAVEPERWRVTMLRKCLGRPIAADLDWGSVGWGIFAILMLLTYAAGDSIAMWVAMASSFLLAWTSRLYRVQCALRAVIFGGAGSGLAEIQLLPSWRSAGSLRRLLPTIAMRVIVRETSYSVVWSQIIAFLSLLHWNWAFYVEFAVAVLSYGAMQACLALMLLASDPSRMRALHSFGLISTGYGLAAGWVSHLLLSQAGAPWGWLAGLWPLLPMSGAVILLIRTRRAAAR